MDNCCDSPKLCFGYDFDDPRNAHLPPIPKKIGANARDHAR